MRRERVLFLCTGNACRSQMAEGFCRRLHAERLEAGSAGTRATRVDPRAIAVMAEVGIDISTHRSKALEELDANDANWIVTVCDRAAESCPLPPPGTHVLHEGFPDPPARAAALADEAAILAVYREVRDLIGAFVRDLPARLECEARPPARTPATPKAP